MVTDLYNLYTDYTGDKKERKKEKKESDAKTELARQEMELKKRQMAIEEEMARTMPVIYAQRMSRKNSLQMGGPVKKKPAAKKKMTAKKKPQSGHNRIY